MQPHPTASRPRDLRHYRLPAAAAAVVLVALLVSQAIQVSPSPGASTSPGASGAITWTAAPTGTTPAPWTRLVLPPDQRLAELNATKEIGRQVATTSHFVLRALGEVRAAELASRLVVEPDLSFTVTPGATADSVSLVPTAELQSGVRYRFRLLAPDGSLAGTWAFRTDAPLRVVSRVPDDKMNDVPVNTGIEVTFDQDAVDVAAHFSISPKVAGSLEQHGRTWAFVPAKALAAATVYTVTVTKGVGVVDSARILDSKVSWQFKTASLEQRANGLVLDTDVVEARVGESPFVVVRYWTREGEQKATTWPYELFRLPSLSAAADAAAVLASEPEWACCQSSALVDTSALRRVAAGKATLSHTGGGDDGVVDYLRLPVQPDPGWYVLVVPNNKYVSQAILQVTDLAAFVQTTDTRTIAWLSDLATLSPVAGATVSIHRGARLGSTDARGVVIVPTPQSLITYETEDYAQPAPTVLELKAADGRGLLAVVGMANGWGYPPQAQTASAARTPWARWWLVLSTDRQTYRSTDTIHAWGVVRSRSDLAVPSNVELRLESESSQGTPAIVTASATPTKAGVFTADLALTGLPHGPYRLSLYAGNERLQSESIEVAEIRKPAYAIDLAVARHVYVAGDRIAVRGTIAFYDGSRAPGVGVQTSLEGTDDRTTTGADGTFSSTFTAKMSEYQPYEGWNWVTVQSQPAQPEEGTISGQVPVVVFPARVWLKGQAALSGDRLSIHGTLSTLDVAKVEAQLADSQWDLDPAGARVAGRQVAIRVIHVIPVRKQVGTTYDFISKLTSPVYQYSDRQEVLLTKTVTTDGHGTLALALDVPTPNHQYRIELTARDSQDRRVRLTLDAWQRPVQVQAWSYPYIVSPSQCGWPSVTAGLGEATSIVVREGTGAVGRNGQYLFMVGERGLADAVWQTSATFEHRFTAADLPSYGVRAVRLLSTGYQVLNPVRVRVDRADKAMAVSLSADRARYAPGQTVTITVRTTGPDGRPIAADTIVRAVDEKLFAIGGALDVDVADELLRDQPDGFLQSFASHQQPYVSGGGCGGGGAGGRGDFRDSATFQRISTGPDGRGTVTFTVPDDLTSWHVSASAVSADLDSGSASLLVPVGLPFFADAVVAPTYLAGERPVLIVRAYGDAIHTGDAVRFVVRSDDLGLDPVTATGTAFQPSSIRLPMLELGRHTVTIEAWAAAGGLSDKLVRTFDVIPSRLGSLEQRQEALVGTLQPAGGDGLTTYVISDAGRGALVPILSTLVRGTDARVDQATAAAVARQLLIDRFSVPASDLPSAKLDMTRYQRGGVALLPYSSADPYLTAMLATVAPESLASPTEARGYLEAQRAASSDGSELQLVSLAGLAGLGDDVLDSLRAIDPTKLSVTSQLWLGLGLWASGDEGRARAIERSLLGSYGQQLGSWVRLETGVNAATTLKVSAEMLLLAGGLGDEAALGLYRYVASQPSTEQVFPIETLAYVKGALDRLPRGEARFAWSVDGARHEVTLEPGAAYGLTLTPSQRRTFSLERLAGALVVNATWTGPADVASLPSMEGVLISRVVNPVSQAPRDRLVHVALTVTFEAGVPVGPFEVTDLTPSGLAPFAAPGEWPVEGEPVNAMAPYAVDGQRVSWVLWPSATVRTFSLAYSARVVSPGTFTWEPAVVQSTDAAVIGNHTAPAAFTIQ